MANELRFLTALVLATGAAMCGPSSPTLRVGAAAPQEIRDACELAAHRCSQCHSADRIVEVRAGDPAVWQLYVRKMRQKPGSDIGETEQPIIVRCLVYRSFGQAGLDQLAADGGAP
jgi:hypothetical protein